VDAALLVEDVAGGGRSAGIEAVGAVAPASCWCCGARRGGSPRSDLSGAAFPAVNERRRPPPRLLLSAPPFLPWGSPKLAKWLTAGTTPRTS